ncbi:MAG: Serine/threonine-protein kinase PrkC [Syntrophaceae bacterium PtaU1.Bin231]|nr:MAG: Serine/threonine-protein kinase PrkC [Syntrophaceae bacterium PtaU1.Bin231]
MAKSKKAAVSDLVIGLILMLFTLAAGFFQWGPIETLEYKFYDLGMRLREQPASSPVVIVAIDDESINALGRWPWPRGYIAHMIDALSGYNAKVIGVNILYSESDFNQGLLEIRDIVKKMEADPTLARNQQAASIYATLKEVEQRLDNDKTLSTSIAGAGRVVLPFYFALGNPVMMDNANLPEYLRKNSVSFHNPLPLTTAREIIPPIPEFAASATALGHINLQADRDGTVRSEMLLIDYGNRVYPSLPLQLTLKYLGLSLQDIVVGEGIRFPRIRIPTYEDHRMLISYNSNFTAYSFVDVINNKVPGEVFKNKIVLLAHSATGLGTMQVTPIGTTVPAALIIANVVNNILNGDHIERPAWALPVEMGVVAFFGLFLAIAIPRLKAGVSALLSLILLIAWLATGAYFLLMQGIWMKVFYPTLLLLVGYIVLVSKEYLFTEKSKERIEADSVETNKMLGLSFQGQGMLDMAFEKFRKCPIEDDAIKELLYNLGLDFERKRMFNKAVAVYEHIAAAGAFKDAAERIAKLKSVGETMIFGAGAARKEGTVILESAQTKPTLGRYEVVKELGHGAMGTVYLGKDPKINREVAIKTLRYEEFDPEQLAEVKKRFFREAEAAGKLAHPNIVTIYDVGEDYEIAYMAMELLDGSDLEKNGSRDSLLPRREVVRIVSAVASALDYAHANGVVHRDIKPANIMILKNGEVKVADFGIARVMASSKTQTGVIMGTPSYMSPEQIAGQKVDGRSDLFSLGVVFFELLTGEKPFAGESIATLIYNITSVPPPRLRELAPDLPEPFEAAVAKMLAKDKEQRYQQGKDVVSVLNELLKSLEA